MRFGHFIAILAFLAGLSALADTVPSLVSETPQEGVTAAQAAAAADHKEYVNPKWVKITLMPTSHVRPALAVWAEGALFFTRAQDPKGRCQGSDVFRYGLGQQKPESVASFTCVIRMLSDGKTLLVHYSDDEDGKQESETHLAYWNGSEMADAFSESIWGWHQGKLQFALDELRWFDRPALAYHYDIVDGRLVILVHPLNGRRFLFYDRYKLDHLRDAEPEDFPEVPQLVQLRMEGDILEASAAGLDRFYLLRNRANRVEVAQLDVKVGEVTQSYGGFAVPSAAWNNIGIGQWGVRIPRYLVGTRRGFIVADRTARLNEAKALSFFSEQNQEFFKLNLPGKDISGISIPKAGGLLISKSTATQVAWYGPEEKAEGAWIQFGKKESQD